MKSGPRICEFREDMKFSPMTPENINNKQTSFRRDLTFVLLDSLDAYPPLQRVLQIPCLQRT